MEERFRFLEDWRSDDWNMAELCRFYPAQRFCRRLKKGLIRHNRRGTPAWSLNERHPGGRETAMSNLTYFGATQVFGKQVFSERYTAAS